MKDDFIELDFGEDEPEAVEKSGIEGENPIRKKGRFFVSYPRKTAGQTTPAAESESVTKPETGETTYDQGTKGSGVPANDVETGPKIQIEVPVTEPENYVEKPITESDSYTEDFEMISAPAVIIDADTDPEQNTSREDTAEDADIIIESEESLSDIEIREIHIAEEDSEEDFLNEVEELSAPDTIEGFFGTVTEIPLPGVEDLPDFDSGSLYGEPSDASDGDGGLTAIPKEREKIRWYLSLPFISLVLLIPVVGIIAGGVLLYLRYKAYRNDQQISDLTTVYILLVICLIIAVLGVYCITQLFKHAGDDAKETVPGQADREAAESLAREEAEEREREELEAWLRTSAQADIGLEEIEFVTKVPADESEAEPGESQGLLSAEESGEGLVTETEPGLESEAGSEAESIEETDGFWSAFLDKLTGNSEEQDQEYLNNVEADLQELAISGDACAQYSLLRLSSEVTLFTVSYDDRFFAERQQLFAFMSSYHGMQIDNQTFHLKSSLVDMFSGTVHWDATLDNTMYRYIGTIEDGMPQGMGVVLVTSNANPNTYIPLYAGTFVNGTMEGYGMTFKENSGFYGIVYEGYYSGGKYTGRGTLYEIPSSVNFQNRLSMQDMAGNQYTPEEISAILNAYATRYSNAMLTYQADNTMYAYLDVPMVTPIITERGRYEKGKANGYCICYGSFGIRQYAGILKNNVRSGQGISYYANGRIQYDGEWKSGGYHGSGVLYNEDGSIWYEGEFANGDIKPVVQ